MIILIVEDTMSTAESLKSLFEENNFHTMIVNNAEDAIDVLKSKKFDVVVSDVNLQAMDGLELSKIIRKTDKDTPIILYTSMNAPEDFEYLAKRMGVTKFISNSNIKETLKAVMSRLDSAFERNEIASAKILST